MGKRRKAVVWGGVLLAAVAISWFQRPLDDSTRAALFGRVGQGSCVPEDELSRGPAEPLRPLREDELQAFRRDGAVVLRGVLDPVWQRRLRQLVHDTLGSPTRWDVLYSRFVANFYCSQKAILLHHTSRCGREVAEAAPTTQLASALLGSASLRVCEPTEALGTFRNVAAQAGGSFTRAVAAAEQNFTGEATCGHTAWHRDDKYFPASRRDAARAAVVRFWIPVVPFAPRNLRFAALNNSAEKRAEREALGHFVKETDFAAHDRLEASGILDRPGQVIDGGERGLQPGDIFAFAGETPHIAEAFDCGGAAAGCLRLILSFAGDSAQFEAGRRTSLLPMSGTLAHGDPLSGPTFPSALPFDNAEFDGFRPSRGELLGSVKDAMLAGMSSFSGYDSDSAWRYIRRVSFFTFQGIWDRPGDGQSPASRLDLDNHFAQLHHEQWEGVGMLVATAPNRTVP